MPTLTELSVALAEAITADLAAGVAAAEFSQTFTPERSYGDWELPPEIGDNRLHVDVVGVMTKQTVEASTRGSAEYGLPIDISVRRRMGADRQDRDTQRVELAEIDQLMLLVGEIHRRYFFGRVPELEDAVWRNTEIVAAPVKWLLKDKRTFLGLVRLTFVTDLEVD